LSPSQDKFSYVFAFGMGDRFALDVDCADRTDFCTFPTRRARAGIRPILVKIHYHLGVFSSQFQVQRVNAFDFIADSYAPSAQYAPISVDDQKVVGRVNFHSCPFALEHNVVDAELIRQTLQFAMIIGNAD